MPWPILVAAAIAAVSIPRTRPETPCEATGIHVARQQLGGDAAGIATVDVSGDGRIVALVSQARLAAGDANSLEDIYTIDRATGRVTLESVPADGGIADGSSREPRLSADGRFIVFSSTASNLAGARPVAYVAQVLRRDRLAGTTTLVSRTGAGAPGNGSSAHPDISADGRYVVFESQATNLVAGVDANLGGTDIYLYDADNGTMRRVSLTDTGVQSTSGQSWTPVIDDHGRFVVFTSTAPIDAPARARPDDPIRSIFRRDLVTGETRRLSATRSGGVPDGASFYPAVSGDGGRAVFVSVATNLAGAERRTRRQQIYLHDADSGRLRLVSRSADGAGADGSSRFPALSGDGRFVVFSSDASDLPCADRCGPSADLNLVSDVYRLDLVTGAAERVSGGIGSREAWWTASGGGAVDAAGHVVAFSSRQPVDEADLEADDDLYIAVLAGTAADATSPSGAVPCGPRTPRSWLGPVHSPRQPIDLSRRLPP